MKPQKIIPIAAVVLMCGTLAVPRANLTDLVTGNNAFAFDLYSRLKTAAGNIFFSPYGISAALAMTYAGARGNTERQMAKVMHFGKDQKAFHQEFGLLRSRLNDVHEKGNVKLAVANSLWMQKDYTFLPSFLALTRQNYVAGFNYVDFKRETEAARVTINAWVERKTNDKITNPLQPGVLTGLTRMVLVNAICFNGAWAKKFDTLRTRDATFWTNVRDSVTTKMMNSGASDYLYAEDKTTQFIKLPYKGDELSMVVVLPKSRNGIGDLERTITSGVLHGENAAMHNNSVVVYLPKFTTTREISLNAPLIRLGMTDAFNGNKADFSGMTGAKGPYISAEIHKAFVDVNEGGTEAAAATAVVMVTKCAPVFHKPIIFRADHPFLFFIYDNETGSIIFMGRMVNPRL